MTTKTKKNGRDNKMTRRDMNGAAVALGMGVGLALVSAIGSSGAIVGIVIAVGFRTAMGKQRHQNEVDNQQ